MKDGIMPLNATRISCGVIRAADPYLELGVGANVPAIIKYPFWKYTAANSKATYVCVNYAQAFAPAEIKDQSICIDCDIGIVLKGLWDLKPTVL